MESKNSSLAILREPFVAGMDENLSPIMQRLWKLEGGAIYFCRSGWAHVTIDLKDYEIVENTQGPQGRCLCGPPWRKYPG